MLQCYILRIKLIQVLGYLADYREHGGRCGCSVYDLLIKSSLKRWSLSSGNLRMYEFVLALYVEVVVILEKGEMGKLGLWYSSARRYDLWLGVLWMVE